MSNARADAETSATRDSRYLATVDRLLRGQAWRERAAADLFETALPLVPAGRWRTIFEGHTREERAHYARVVDVWSTAFGRAPAELDAWVTARLVAQPLPRVASFLELGMAQFLFDRAGRWQISEYLTSSFLPYRALAHAIVDEERGHEDVGARLVVELCAAPGVDRAAAQAAFDRWLGIALLSFGRASGDGNAFAIAAGLKMRDSGEVTRAFLGEIAPTVRTAGLVFPGQAP
ncbi:MAG TPA: Phenylacetic acid catabolic protein [Polyangia bacterium]|nr:Phenylacetic acid catabolic protein [Polyangia bacterium]